MNRVEIIGRLTRDVEVRKTNSGLSVAQFTVAVDRRVSKNTDDGQPRADFVQCIAWRQSADFLGSYAKKGNLIGIEGRIQTGSYEKNGQKVYTTSVVCDNVQLLESRKSREATATGDAGSAPTELQHDPAGDFGSDESLSIASDDLPF